MVLSFVLYGLLALVSFVYLYLKNGKKYWQSRGVLTQPAHLILGNFKGVSATVHFADRLNEIYSEFKDKDKFCGVYFLNRPVALITDLELVRDICIKEFSKFHDRGVYYNEESDPLTAHLFSLAGTKWKHMRNKLSPTFTSGKLKLMCRTIVDIAENMQKIVAKEVSIDKTLDVKRLCVRYSTDVIASTAFGLDTKTLENDDAEILKISDLIFKATLARNFKMFFINSYQGIAHKLGLKLFPDAVTNFFMTLLRETVEYREQSDVKRNDFIDILIRIKNSGTIEAENACEEEHFVGKITFNELAAQAFVFFFAGFETSSTVMSYCLLQLALNQDIQHRLHKEIQSVLRKHDDRLTYDGVGEMIYLEQCFNEALRLISPSHSLIREVTEEYKVLDTSHILEKGTQIFIPIYAIHRDENIYPDPLKYDPDRFTPENIKSRHPYAFLPFGEGPRNCIGMRFALLQSKIFLASILAKFRVSVNEKTKLPIELDVENQNMAVNGGIWLDFEKI